MRISTAQLHQQGIASMLDAGRQIARTQEQIATGRKFTSPADDPVAASRIVKINQELALREQYQRNIHLVSNQLGLEDSVLGQANDVLQRVRELAVQSGNGALSQTDRGFIAKELETRLDELFSIMNAKTASGEYLFSGFKGRTQPFSRDAANGVEFHGDEGQRQIQVSATSFVAANDSGKRIFMDVESVAPTFIASAHPANDPDGMATIGQGVVVDQAALDELFPDNVVIEFRPTNEVASNEANFTVRRMSDGRVIDGLQNVTYAPGATVEFSGMQVRLFGDPRQGDRFVVETTERQSLVTTVARLTEGLKTLSDSGEDQRSLDDLIASSLGNLENAMDSILEVRAEVGARMNTAESSAALHEDVTLVSQELLSELRDVDFAEAVSLLNLQAFVLEAAQKSFSRISNISLFNSL